MMFERDSELNTDERGVMIFALVGVAILLLSIYAGVYFASIRLDAQRDVVDLGSINKVEREIDRIEMELNAAAEEAGHRAVEIVKGEVLDGYITHDLKEKISRESARIFEDHFEEHYSGMMEIGGLDVELTIRPLGEGQENIELIPLYIEDESKERRRKIPGFFTVNRTIYAHVEDPSLGMISTRRLDINREVRTDIFVIAERARHFDPMEIRKNVDSMMSAYMDAKIFSGSIEKDIGFKEDFSETFPTDWQEAYADGIERNDNDEREEPWIENSTGFIEGFERDIGELESSDLLSEKELVSTVELAVLIEQMRVFRSYDESLISSVSEYFDVDESEITELIGEGEHNRLNLQRLILILYQEKGVLPEKVFYPGLFLEAHLEDDLLSFIDDDERWTEITFGMMDHLVSGGVDGEDSWDYENFEKNVESIEDLGAGHSYLRVLFSMYSNTMEDVLRSFNVDCEEAEVFVFEEMKKIGPIPWMEDIEIIGERGVEEIIRSILYRGENLSMSFGFEGGNYEETVYPFYYMYFFNDWGYDLDDPKEEDPIDKIDTEGIERGVEDKIRSEIRGRAEDYQGIKNSSYSRVDEMISDFAENDWYRPENETQDRVWDRLNDTLDPLSDLSESELFTLDGDEPPYVSDEIDVYHPELEEKIEEVKTVKSGLDEECKEYTEKILELETNYTGVKWRYEVYDHLYGSEEDFLNLTDRLLTSSAEEISYPYNWSLKEYSLEDHIDPSRKTDQSIGQRALGDFTDEVIRNWESPTPMDYSRPRSLFRLINQNLDDLKDFDEDIGKNRLGSILLGEGDPYSDNLEQEDLSTSEVELVAGPVSSDNRLEVDEWFLVGSLDRTINGLEDILGEMEKVAEDMTDEDIRDEPFSDYSDASFYKTAGRVISPLIETMEDYIDSVRSSEAPSGRPIKIGENAYRRAPIISMPREELTLYRSPEPGKDDTSYSLDIDIDPTHKDDFVEVHDMEVTTTRVYRGDIDDAYEWVNPFSERSGDQYRTLFFMDYSTTGLELQVGTDESAPLGPQRSAGSKLNLDIEKHRHKGLAEVISPLPLLDRRYAFRSPSSSEIEDISLDANVLSPSKDGLRVDLEFPEGTDFDEEKILLEALIRDDLSYTAAAQRGKLANLDHLFNEEIEEDPHQRVLARRWVETEEIEKGGVDLELDEIDIPEDEDLRGHISVRLRSGIEVSYMKERRGLEQSSSQSDNFTPVPLISSIEQGFVFEDGREKIDVFRFGKGLDSLHDYDLIDDIPEDSWIIQKNGLDHLVEFGDDLKTREVLSGVYRGPFEDHPISDISIDHVTELHGVCKRLVSLPDSPYGRLLETELLPVHTSIETREDSKIPEGVISFTEEIDDGTWDVLRKEVIDDRDILRDQDAQYLYREIGKYHGEMRADNSFRSTRESIVDTGTSSISNFTFRTDGLDILKDADTIDEFSEASRSDRRDIFSASCYTPDRLETVEDLADDRFDLGPVANSVDLIGEQRSRDILDWLLENREVDHSDELTAFLSFEEDLVKHLPERMGVDEYYEALGELDDSLDNENFVEARRMNIKDLADIESLRDLLQDFEEKTLLAAAGLGIRPSAADHLIDEKSLELDVLLRSMEKFVGSPRYRSFVEELNSRDFERVPSYYTAGNADVYSAHWLPYGDDDLVLELNGRIVHAEIASVDSMPGLYDFVDGVLERAVEMDLFERVELIVHVPEFTPNDEEIQEILEFIESKSKEYDPGYSNISSVSLIFHDESVEADYFHL